MNQPTSHKSLATKDGTEKDRLMAVTEEIHNIKYDNYIEGPKLGKITVI